MGHKKSRKRKKIKAKGLTEVDKTDIAKTLVTEDVREILTFQPWFGYEFADYIIRKLGRYYEEAKIDKEIRPLGIFLCGDINSGKTTLLIRFMNIMREREDYKGDSIIYIEIPVRATLKKVFAQILAKFGKPIRGRALDNLHTQDLVDMIIEELKRRKVRILIIDELQDLLIASHEDKVDIFNGFKKIFNACSTRFVLVGTKPAKDLLYLDQWIDERLVIHEIPQLKDDNNFYNLLGQTFIAYQDFVPNWNLAKIESKNTLLFNKVLCILLLELSQGRLGKLIQIIRYSIIEALEDGRRDVLESDYRDIFNNDVVFTIIDERLYRITSELDQVIKSVQKYQENYEQLPTSKDVEMKEINALIKSGKFLPFGIRKFEDLLVIVSKTRL